MSKRSMDRKERDSGTPEAQYTVKRNIQANDIISTISALKKRIRNAVSNTDPAELSYALTVRTRQNTHLTYSIEEINKLYRVLVLPSTEMYLHNRKDLIKCLRQLVEDDRFVLPVELMEKVVKDKRQLVPIVKVLLEGSTANEFPAYCLEHLVYVAITEVNDEVLKVVIQQIGCDINQMRDSKFRPLNYAVVMMHVVKDFNNKIVPTLLAHHRIDPNLRSLAVNMWMTPLALADDSYNWPKTPMVKNIAAQTVHQLLSSNDVDIHTINDNKRAFPIMHALEMEIHENDDDVDMGFDDDHGIVIDGM